MAKALPRFSSADRSIAQANTAGAATPVEKPKKPAAIKNSVAVSAYEIYISERTKLIIANLIIKTLPNLSEALPANSLEKTENKVNIVKNIPLFAIPK